MTDPNPAPHEQTGTDNPLSSAFWRRPLLERQDVFARLRRMDEPVYHRRPASGRWQVDDGFHALVRYEDVMTAGCNPACYSSKPTSVSLDDTGTDVRDDDASIINLDNPRHARIRRIANHAVSPASIDRIDAQMRATARRTVDSLVARGPCDFVAHVARPLPDEIICRLIGIPEQSRAQAIDNVEVLLQIRDADSRIEPARVRDAVEEFRALISSLVEQRRHRPTGDLLSTLVQPHPGREPVTEHAATTFVSTLISGGTETVRTALAVALTLLTEYPQQRRLLLEDLPGRLPAAVEETLRFAAPAAWMRRTVTRPTRIRNHTFEPGDKVVLFYAAANWDEHVFDQPASFDIRRAPNPHLAFGTPSTHHCLGAYLARRELTILLTELLTRIPDIRATKPPLWRAKGVIQDITYLPCAFG
ncbi:cytochrome P450 [Embleya sp. NPDC059237]|uniref:cytochrome P450 n=1 Tax=Embleya sp. NPDC059237 TaxID=3346784 RepID=UPI003682F6AC